MRKQQQLQLDELTNALQLHAIHGRGGANFPTAAKLRAVAAQRGRPIVVVNAAEGEPLSQKDRYLLSSRLGTVIDGALAAAQALSADEIVFAVGRRQRDQVDALTRAIESHEELQSERVRAGVSLVPSGYVTGQETALISALSGGVGKPTLTPPRPFERGLRGRPTLVCNAETYSHIGRVARGTYDGKRLVTVAGAVAVPGLVDVGSAATLAAVLDSAGGIVDGSQAVLLGGYGGSWAPLATVRSLTLDETTMRAHGLTLGAGIVFVLGDVPCPVAEVASVTSWMAAESAGQCGPCVHGLGAIADALNDLTQRGDSFARYAQVRRWTQQVKRRGACAHPDGVARFVTSALDTFAVEFDDHARYGRCHRCSTRTLPTPQRRHNASKTAGLAQRALEADRRRDAALL